jgi:hypothetical protein
VNAAPNVLEAQAQFDSPERKVFVRVVEHDGLIYLDLGMSSGAASKSSLWDGGSPKTLQSGSALRARAAAPATVERLIRDLDVDALQAFLDQASVISG